MNVIVPIILVVIAIFSALWVFKIVISLVSFLFYIGGFLAVCFAGYFVYGKFLGGGNNPATKFIDEIKPEIKNGFSQTDDKED